MKKGFTLVELLAVIVILSVIAIITVPIIGNVIEESKKKALEQSAYGLVEAADLYAINNDGEYSFLFDNNHKGENIDKTRQLDYKGSIEGKGKLYINNNGDISLCINTDKYYVYKSYDSGIAIGNISDKGECSVKKLGNHYVAYLENEEPDDYITSSDLALYALKTDLNNYVTKEDLQDAFDLKLGTEKLTTTSQNVIGAINEINYKISDSSKLYFINQPNNYFLPYSILKSSNAVSSVTVNNGGLYIKTDSHTGNNNESSYTAVVSNNSYDLTNYTKLVINYHVAAFSGDANILLYSTKPTNISNGYDSANFEFNLYYANFDGTSTSGEIAADISNLKGEYFIVLGQREWGNAGRALFKITSLYAE